jgi:hypothetical protein
MHLAIRPAGKTAAHARSASLPHEHSHPVLAYLDDTIRTLRSWSSAGAVCQADSGITLIDAVLAALGDLLVLPQAVSVLHEAAACDQILDRFLVLADAYGTFQSALIALKQSVAELQAGTRRGDGEMVAASLRAHRRTEKELSRLVAAMRHATRCTVPAARPADSTDGEVVGVVAEVAAATAEASEAIFWECAAMSPAVAQTSNRWLARLSARAGAKRAAPETAMAALERLENLEECIDGLATGSEKVFRRLLQSRVTLLNIHTPF